jgi:hypothetical protein
MSAQGLEYGKIISSSTVGFSNFPRPIQVADSFPMSEVIATDLSPIQPTWVPPNLQFLIDDCEADWAFERKFDFIRLGHLVCARWKNFVSSEPPRRHSPCWATLRTLQVD